MGIAHHLRAVLQHAARPGRHAVLRPRGVLGPGRLHRGARAQHGLARASSAMPVSLLPLVGGLAGAFFGVLFGYVTTKRAGTTFAMITLGIGELVFACSLMFPDFFGGEGGITTNRVVGQPFLGITFGPAIQVYYLIAVWSLRLHGADVRLDAARRSGAWPTRCATTPSASSSSATTRRRCAGSRSSSRRSSPASPAALALHQLRDRHRRERGAARSGGVLLVAFIGGVGFFFGPIIGACCSSTSWSRCRTTPRPGCSTSACSS